jgi:uncharacterized DUF497 family protein
MRVTDDPEKRERTFRERGLDFEDAQFVFSGVTLELEDTRKDYGEVRIICYGLLEVAWWLSATRRVARTATSSA